MVADQKTAEAKIMAAKLRGHLHYASLVVLWNNATIKTFCGEEITVQHALSVTEHWWERSKMNTPQCKACVQYLRDHPEIGPE